jgi:hypothetical protein
MDPDQASKKRSAETTKALLKAGAGIGAAAMVGAEGGLAVTALAQLVDHGWGVLKERRWRRIERFHRALLGPAG